MEQFRNDFPTFYRWLKDSRGDPIEHVLPPASEEDIRQIEDDLGLPLPESYKQFLRCARGFWLRGGTIQFGTQHPFVHDFAPLSQLTPQQLEVVKAKGGVWPPPSQGMLCFAEFFLEADGEQVLFDVTGGLKGGEYPVMYYAHEDVPPSVRKLADSFSLWLQQFLTHLPNRRP